MKVGFKINLDSHHINLANSKLNIIPNYPEIGIEVRFIIIILKELPVIYARIINHFIFKHQTVFSARFVEQDEDNQVVDETEFSD